MAREPQNTAMREEFKRWLAHRNINLNEVKNDFSLKHAAGLTEITFTMLVTDFPVRKEPPSWSADHSECGPGCTFKKTNETPSV